MALFTLATKTTEAKSEYELESEESSNLVWINTTEAEMEASLLFKMAEGRYIFCSKSCVKGLGMSYVIGLFFCLRFLFRSTVYTWLQVMESEVES